MKKRILLAFTASVLLFGCGKSNESENRNENVITASIDENAEVKEAELTDCSSDTGTLPDLYYDVFMKYCKKEDIEVNTFDTVLAEVEDSEYTIKGYSDSADVHEFIAGTGFIGVTDDSGYYCGITFKADNEETGNSKIYAINFGQLGIGEIDIRFDTSMSSHEYYILENKTITDVESVDELDKYAKEKLVK